VINALLVTGVGINALISTIGMMTILQGSVQAFTGGRSITSGIPDSLLGIARTTFLGIPMPVFYMVAIGIVAWYVLERTPLGRYMHAVGGARDAARLAGIRATRLTVIAFLVSGTLGGVGGAITASRIGAAHPSVGPEFLLPAFAAAYLGAAAIKPGTFNVLGTLIAVFTLGTGVTGLQLMGAPFYITPLFNGAALILAVSVTRYLQRESL
jgi:ribose transport system permease protein